MASFLDSARSLIGGIIGRSAEQPTAPDTGVSGEIQHETQQQQQQQAAPQEQAPQEQGQSQQPYVEEVAPAEQPQAQEQPREQPVQQTAQQEPAEMQASAAIDEAMRGVRSTPVSTGQAPTTPGSMPNLQRKFTATEQAPQDQAQQMAPVGTAANMAAQAMAQMPQGMAPAGLQRKFTAEEPVQPNTPASPVQQGNAPAVAATAVDNVIGSVVGSMPLAAQSTNTLGEEVVPVAEPESMQPETTPAADPVTIEEAEDLAVDREADNIVQDIGPAAIEEDDGVVEKAPSYGLSRKNRTFTTAFNDFRSRVKNKLSKKNKVKGVAFTGVIFADENLPVHCISIGSDLLEDSLRDPDSGLFDLVKDYEDFSDGIQGVTFDQALRNIGRLAKIIDNHDIPATVEKSPVNVGQSVQVRTVRVHPGGGIGIHPTQGKVFNADFDSDTMTVNMDPDNIHKYSRAMNYLIGNDGNPTTDMDFFLVDEITDDQVDDVKFSMKNMELAFKWAPNIVDLIFDDYRELCNSADKTAALRKLIYKIDKWAEYYSPGQPKYIATSRIYKALYDFGRVRRGRSIQRQVSSIVANDAFALPDEPTHPFVVDLIDYVNGVIAGRTPMNSVEFGEFFNKQFADYSSYDDANPDKPSGRNIPFRLIADFCKAIHRTDLITIGDPIFGIDFRKMKPDDPVSLQQVWEVTSAAIQTKILKGAEYLGSHELSVKTQVQERILETIGLPQYDGVNDGQVLANWIFQFIDAYNLEMRVLNMSNIAIRNGYRIERDKVKYDGIDMDDIDRDLATALLEVFGEVAVDRLLPPSLIEYKRSDKSDRQNTGRRIDPSLQSMSLNRFSMTNRLRFESEVVLDQNGNPVRKKVVETLPNGDKVEKYKTQTQSRKAGAKDRLQHRIVDPYDILFIIADKRTAKIGDYCEQWEKATQENVDLINSIMGFQDSRDFGKYMEDMLDLMFQVSPDMFEFFGMENPINFVKSKHGKRLVNIGKAKDVESYRSELVSMLVEWRLNKSSRIRKSINEADEGLLETPENESIDRIEELEIALDKEYDLLASASPVWSAIVAEIRAGAEDSYFRRFMRGAAAVDVNKSEWTLHAKKFWDDPESVKYGTLITFLKSSEPYSTKMAVLSDIVRFRENFPEIGPKSIIGYMAYNPNRFHDGSPYDMDMGIQRELDAVKGSIDSMSSYKNKMPQEIEQQHTEFMENVRANPGAFATWLGRMATERNWAVHLDTITAADAIASVFEKGMPDSEKVQQQAAVNGFFECVSTLINGGFYTHFEQADNKVVNVVGYDRFTFLDLVRLLGDPSMELYVYDEFGTMVKEPLSRSSICGGDSIQDVIDWLGDNPRISMQLRRHVLGVNHMEGSGTKSGIKSRAKINRLEFDPENDEEYDEVADRVFALLADRPRFFASCCLVTPSLNDVGRNISEQANAVIRYVCNMLAYCSLTQAEDPSFDAGTYIDEQLGVTEDRILEILLGPGIDGIEMWDADLEERARDAHAIYMTFHREMLDCIDLISDTPEMRRTTFNDLYYNPITLDMSSTSVRAFQDVVQQLGGSRTAKMLSVEGAETKRNECFKVFISARKERYSMEFSIDGLPSVVQTDIENPQDPTLGNVPSRQQKSIAKFLEIKRETGAEKGNAKVRKYGDDGKNSIVKFEKYTKESIELATQLRDQIENAPDRETAIALLADALVEADEDLGYIDTDTVFMLSDYLNRADLMIGENSDGSFVIRTMEQLSAACRTRIDDEVIYNMTKEEQIAALDAIVEVVGTDRDPMARSDSSIAYDVMIDLAVHGTTSSKFSVDRARRARSSSVDRNYTLLYRLTRKFARNIQGKDEFKAPSRKAIEKRARQVYHALDKDMQKAVRGYAMPSMRKNEQGKWQLGNDWSKSFDLLGRANDKTTMANLIPGPQSLVLFDESVNENWDLMNLCYSYGITIGIYSDSYPDAGPMDGDLIQVDNHLWVIPCFDMQLNGSISNPVMPAPAQIKVNASNYVTSFKDTTGEFGPSDAGAVIAQQMADRTHVTLQGRDPEIFSMEDLFPNALRNVRGEVELEIPTRAEIQKYIVNQYDFEDGYHPEIDLGVPDTDERGFERALGRYDIRIKEYIDRFYTDTNEHGFITQNCRHDSIIGFVKITMNDGDIAFAPIVPFPPDRSGVRPKMFNMTGFGTSEPYGVDPNTNSFFFTYEYSGGIDDQVIKYYEGYGSSNKFVVSRNRMKARTLANGWNIDLAYFHKAVASRLFPSNQRITTMVSAWHAAKFMPEFSYNFGLLAGAFPDDPQFEKEMPDGTVQTVSLKQMLRTQPFGAGGLTREDWRKVLPNIGKFYADDGTKESRQIDAMVRHLVTKAVEFGTVNPSILLCSRTEDALLEPWITEFETFMDTSLGFEDAWLKFMHAMCPTMVPNGIYGDDSKTLFKVEKRDGAIDPFGTLVCLVPHYMPETGEEYKVPECVFISPGFFGDTFSGIKNIQYNSNNRFLDSLNVADNLPSDEQSMILEHGSAGMSHVKMSMNTVSIASDNMVETVKQDEVGE